MGGRRDNGGVIGAEVVSSSTAAGGVWSMNRAAQGVRGSASDPTMLWPGAKDANFSSVGVLLHFRGVSGQPTFFNSGSGDVPYPSGGAAANQPTVDTTQAKFGYTSGKFYNATQGYIQIPAGSTVGFGTGDVTVEGWIYPVSVSIASQIIVDQRPSEPSVRPLIYVSNANLLFYVNGSARITGTSAVTINTWQHWAWARASGVSKLYVAGAQVGSNYTDANDYSSAANFNIGNQQVAGGNGIGFGGWMQELRVTKGVARYTGATYTVPTAPFPDY